MPTSKFSGFFGYLMGNEAEYLNPTDTVAKAIGREVTRASSKGYIKVKFNVTCKNMEKYGFDLGINSEN